MLKITIPSVEIWDSEKEEFIVIKKEQIITLEHSLVSISKWESRWCKPFLSKTERTYEETIDYIKCMTLTQNVDPEIYERLDQKCIQRINMYIKAPMTATKIYEEENKGPINREQLTSELIYYAMIANEIPFECQKWHLNRLLTLIRVCSIKNRPPKKMNQNDLRKRNAALNASRRKALHSRG